jgi:hypothetical protein
MPNHVSIYLQVHQYCAGGINAVVDPAFHKMEAKLHTIKSANDAYSGRQLTFFSLEDRSVSGVELSSSLLEAIVQMNGAWRASRQIWRSALHQAPQDEVVTPTARARARPLH